MKKIKYPDKKHMSLAIKKAKEGIKKGQSPFGACIMDVKTGKVVSCEHNIVWKACDITAHGEVHAIRVACKKLKSIELKNCVIYSTCEPCPMCFTACHWAKIKTIIYGASIKDAKDSGFSELTLSNKQMKKLGKSKVEIVDGFMKKECVELFKLWKENKNRKLY